MSMDTRRRQSVKFERLTNRNRARVRVIVPRLLDSGRAFQGRA